MCKSNNLLGQDQRNYGVELNQINKNFKDISHWVIVHGDGRDGWLIPSDLEHSELAELLFQGLPETYRADLWLVSDSSLSPKDLLDR